MLVHQAWPGLSLVHRWPCMVMLLGLTGSDIRAPRDDLLSMFYQVWNLTLKMLGKKSKPLLTAKAAETKGLLEFVVLQLQERRAVLETLKPKNRLVGELLLEAGISALKFEHLLKQLPLDINESGRQELSSSFNHFIQCYWKAGGEVKPKVHMMRHLIRRSSGLGNPRSYSQFRNESVNGVLARIARSCHRRSWNIMVHKKSCSWLPP